jgi:hypothetical protein
VSNDFARWGQRGGKRTAALKHWVKNLKWGRERASEEIARRRVERLILQGVG